MSAIIHYHLILGMFRLGTHWTKYEGEVQCGSRVKKIFCFVGTSPPWLIFRPRWRNSQGSWAFLPRLFSTKGEYFVQRNHFLQQNNISCHKKLFLVTKNYCFLLEIESNKFRENNSFLFNPPLIKFNQIY